METLDHCAIDAAVDDPVQGNADKDHDHQNAPGVLRTRTGWCGRPDLLSYHCIWVCDAFLLVLVCAGVLVVVLAGIQVVFCGAGILIWYSLLCVICAMENSTLEQGLLPPLVRTLVRTLAPGSAHTNSIYNESAISDAAAGSRYIQRAPSRHNCSGGRASDCISFTLTSSAP